MADEGEDATMRLKCYGAAIYAHRPAAGVEVETEDETARAALQHVKAEWLESVDLTTIFIRRLHPLMVFAHTEAEAEQRALERAREWCPPEEGWTGHLVHAREFPREWFVEALEKTAEDSGADEDADEGATGRVM